VREDRDTETEFVTVSYWEGLEAMSRFAGSDLSRIHHLPRDREFLIELPEHVQILTLRVARKHWRRSWRYRSGKGLTLPEKDAGDSWEVGTPPEQVSTAATERNHPPAIVRRLAEAPTSGMPRGGTRTSERSSPTDSFHWPECEG
jgi:hypothetical protein